MGSKIDKIELVQGPGVGWQVRSASGGAYSAEQWQAIFAAIEDMQKRPILPEAASKIIDRLRSAAKGFECGMAENPNLRRRTLIRKWRQIGASAKKLQGLVDEAMGERERELIEGAASVLLRELNQAAGHCEALLKLRVEARGRVVHYRAECSVSDDDLVLPRRAAENPRTMFFFSVLEVWTKAEGKLTYSTHPLTGKIGGKLANYFSAATLPVMGHRAPSLQTLPAILQRQKRLCEHIREWAERLAMERAHAAAE